MKRETLGPLAAAITGIGRIRNAKAIWRLWLSGTHLHYNSRNDGQIRRYP